MSAELHWSLDFCLSCDRQIPDGLYCSQACRLADLDKADVSEPATPSYSSWSSGYGGRGSFSSSPGFRLPPAFDFTTHKSSHNTMSVASSVESPSPRNFLPSPPPPPPPPTLFKPDPQPSGHFWNPAFSPTPTAASGRQPDKGLTPSSSRSSLCSIESVAVNQAVSDVARNQLRAYSTLFEQRRACKRKSTIL